MEKQMKQNNKTNNTRTIEVGKFYLIFDGSRTGHPGFIVSKNEEKNRFLVVITESDKFGNVSKREADKRHLTDLNYPTQKNVARSYIKNRPMLCRRRDIGKKELNGMYFHKKDMEKVLYVSKQKPVLSPSNKKTTDEPTRSQRVPVVSLLNQVF